MSEPIEEVLYYVYGPYQNGTMNVHLKSTDEIVHTFSLSAMKNAVEVLQDVVDVYGIKDGKQVYLGTASTPPRMKARELARDMFGSFEEGDGSDADLCFAVLEEMIEYMQKTT